MGVATLLVLLPAVVILVGHVDGGETRAWKIGEVFDEGVKQASRQASERVCGRWSRARRGRWQG